MGRGGVQVQVLVFNNVSIVRTFILVPQQDGYLEVGKIGRASCRERV